MRRSNSALAVGVAVAVALCALLVAQTAQAGVIGYWRFEGDSSTFKDDSSGNGFTLTAVGDPSQYALPTSGKGSAFHDPIPKNHLANDKAADFDGNDYFRCADDPKFAVSDFTIEAYIHADALSGVSAIAGQMMYSPSDRAWVFTLGSNGTLGLHLANPDGSYGQDIGSSALTVSAGKDYFVAASFDLSDQTSGVTFYCQNLTDGGPLQSETKGHTRTAVHDSTHNFNIGCYYPGQHFFDGLIDEVRWSDTVLSPGELLAVPEPCSVVLFGIGLAGVAVHRRRERMPARNVAVRQRSAESAGAECS